MDSAGTIADVDFFFMPPWPSQSQERQSTLYLARRELQDCLLGDVFPEERALEMVVERRRLFATTMVVMATVDLLAKFYEGADRPGQVEARFVKFVERFFPLTGSPRARDFAQVIYHGCRNPIMHAFNLYSSKQTMGLTTRLPGNEIALWSTVDPKSVVVSVEGLFSGLLSAIRLYEAQVRSTEELQRKFETIFPTHGFLSVGHQP